MKRDLADLEARRQQLLTGRRKVVRQLIANDGWKGAVSHPRWREPIACVRARCTLDKTPRS